MPKTNGERIKANKPRTNASRNVITFFALKEPLAVTADVRVSSHGSEALLHFFRIATGKTRDIETSCAIVPQDIQRASPGLPGFDCSCGPRSSNRRPHPEQLARPSSEDPDISAKMQ